MALKHQQNAVLEKPFSSIKGVNGNIWQSTCDSNNLIR